MTTLDQDAPGTANMIINKFGGRTFLLALGCGVATTLLCWFGKIDGNTYSLVVISVVGGYITGNTVRAVKETQAATTKETS